MVAPAPIPTKPFRPGTTGWRASDLHDPRVEQMWEQGRYEIINGALTETPPPFFGGQSRLFELQPQVRLQQEKRGVPGQFANEVDIIVDDLRLVRADAVWMTPGQLRRQARAARLAGRPDPERTRILVPPTLVIESVSEGHEAHDRKTKFAWYAGRL